MNYRAPLWMPGGHLQTIWPALLSPRRTVTYQRESWETPDGDAIVADWLPNQTHQQIHRAAARPLLVLFHGLEGSSRSHYAQAFGAYAQERGWDYVVPHFRGCGGVFNHAPRAYHSGDYLEMEWILRRLRTSHLGPIVAIGISLGGNALLRWLQESGTNASRVLNAAVSICAPVDLRASGEALGRGFNQRTYTAMFLKTMKPKALQKWNQFPGLFDRNKLRQARTLYEFDDVFTAPLHGFRGADDYWQRASAKPHMQRIQLPTLVVHARNDPFVPEHSLPTHNAVSEAVTLWRTRHGGHVGFATGPFPGHLRALPQAVGAWVAPHLNG